MSTLKLHFLGTMELHWEDQLLSKPPTLKSQSLFAFLVCHRDQPQPRERLSGLFWGERPAHKARNSLSTALWHIRRCLPGAGLLLSDSQTVQCDPQANLWLDVEAFAALAAQPDTTSLQSAVALYRGDFLDGFYDDWIVKERYRLETLFGEALARLMVGQEEREEHEAALATALRLLDHDPLQEDAHRLVMRVFCRLGQRNAALEQYQRCQEVLQQELDVEPMAETTALYQAIREGRFVVGRVAGARPARMPEREPAAPPGRSPLDVVAPGPLVGRTDELAYLHEHWHEAEAGRGRLVLVHGEAGVGKTRLVEDLANRLRWRGVHVLWGRCYEFERVLPYQPLAEALRGEIPNLKAQSPSFQIPNLGDVWLAELSHLLPELRQVCPSLPEPLPAAGETARQRFFEAVARFLVALSAPGPLLIVLEDLHWATESTLQLLHYLTRHLADRPVLLVGTFRSEMVRPAHPLLALQHQLTQAGLAHTLHLAPLSAEAVESLVATLSGAGDVVMPLARRLYQETEGNPFFLMETVKMLFETDVLRLEEAAWRGDFARLSTRAFPLPPSVSEAIQSRVRRLGAATQKALGRAAVLGREFDFDLLHAVWGQDEETTLEALDDLLRHRLIDEGAGALGRDYAFTHHKIQEAVYAALPRRRRQHVHARAGAVLERLYGPPAEAQAGELAYHFGRAEIHDKAISYLIQAGDYARQSYACVEACQHYTSALELAERAAWPETNLTVATIHERRGQARAAVVDMGGARRDLYWVVEWARRVGDQHKEAETLLNLIEPLLVGHQVDEAFTCAREAYALADTLQDHHLIAGSTGAIGSALCVKGALDEAHDYLQTALTAAREHGAREILSGILFYCALARYWMADFRGALALVDEGQALAEELHDPSRAIGMGLVGALTWCSLGEYDTALRYLAEADELARKAQVATAPAELLNTRGWVHQEIYNLERSTRLNQECTVVARELGEIESEANAWVNLGVDHLWSGNLDRAEACFTEAWGLLDKQFGGFRWRWKTRLFAAWGELYLYRGEATRALDYAEQCLTLAGQTSARKNLVKGWKLKGEALTALGRLDEAAAWLRQAIALAGDIGNPPLAWKSRYALGRVLERQGQSAAAQRQYQQAAVAIERTAADLSDPALRETFLQAGPVRTVLDAAGCSRL